MKVEDNPFPYITLVEQASAPATPAAGKAKLYRGTDNKNYILDDGGVSAQFPGSSGTFVGCRLRRTAAYSAGSATTLSENLVPWDTEDYDTDGFHDLVTNPSRLTIPAGLAGYYSLTAGAGYSVDNTGRAIFRVYKNGATVPGACDDKAGGAGVYPAFSSTTDLYLAVGDYLELSLRVAAVVARSVDLSVTAFTLRKIG